MSVPKPSDPLTGHCAAVDSDVLYVYGVDHFQSLPLKKNATWSEEANGQPVADPACVKAVHNGDEASAALYVIGGDTDMDDYSGLQRYSFGQKSWETLSPLADVLKTRTNHSAAYLPDSQSILVYGGSPSDAPTDLSSQTFLISTKPPYNIQSFVSNAPPTNQAILLPWNSSHAVMVGGDSTNTAVWLFGPDDGWQQLETNLAEPLDPAARAVILDGTDGSKVLQVYDMNVSPNTVRGIVLLGPGGATASTGQTVGGNATSGVGQRDLRIGSWPTYNGTNAPTSTRQDCSVSQNSDGVAVVAGGNANEPVVLFDQTDNSWLDADRFFDSHQVQQPLLPSSSSTASSSPTATDTMPSSTTTAVSGSSGGESAHDKMLRTLGITLGVLCGIAAVFIIVLLILRWRKIKAKKQNGGFIEEKDGGPNGDRLSFADRGASFMKEAGGSASELEPPNPHRYAGANNSHSSLAIIAGKFGPKRNTFGHQAKDSFESTAQLVKDRSGNLVPSEQHEMVDIGNRPPNPAHSSLAVPGTVAQGTSLDKETRIERKRSSGWSKYFATSQPTGPNGLSHLPSAYVKPKTLSAADSEHSSDQSQIPSSAAVPALEIDFSKTLDGQRLSHVAQGSPSISDSRDEFARRGASLDIRDGQKGVIVDPAESRKSQATSISSYGNRSTISSSMASEYYNESGHTGHTMWTPMSGVGHHATERSASSIYTASIHNPEDRRPSRGKSSTFFPGAGTNYRPPKVKLSHAAGPTSEWASPRMPAAKAEARDSTASDVTVFPGASDFDHEPSKVNNSRSTEQAAPGAKTANTDMSWLNLGLNKNH